MAIPQQASATPHPHTCKGRVVAHRVGACWSSGLCNGTRGVVIGFEEIALPYPDATQVGAVHKQQDFVKDHHPIHGLQLTNNVLGDGSSMLSPIVRFLLPSGKTTKLAVMPVKWSVETGGKVRDNR